MVNGRFLGAKRTGLHRVARNLLASAKEAGLETEVVAPPAVVDPAVDRTVPGPPGRLGAHLWEQIILPIVARRRLVLSLANTAPVFAARGAVMVHDLSTVRCPQWFRPELRLYGRISLSAARRADVVLTVSEAVAGELEGAGVPSGRIHIVRPAVDPLFRPASDEAVDALRRRYSLERPYVVHLGWADPRKNVATVVEAHLGLVGSVPHDLVLAGLAHPNFAPVDIPDAPSVRRLGYVDDGDLPALLSGAHALVYPSIYEGFGLPPLEALSCGTPALVSDIPSLRESTSGAAMLLPPEDVSRWRDAIKAALDRSITPGQVPPWSWQDAGAALVKALSD